MRFCTWCIKPVIKLLKKKIFLGFFLGFHLFIWVSLYRSYWKGQYYSTKIGGPSTTDFAPREINWTNKNLIKIAKNPNVSDEYILIQISKNHPNFPKNYFQKYKEKQSANKKACAKFPHYNDIHFNNVYWQTLETSNGTFYLYAAYYDNRTLVVMKPVIRILGMINRIEPKVKTYCQLWFKGLKDPIISKVFEYKYIWYRKWGNHRNGPLHPYLLGCQIPKDYSHLVPASVSLVEKPCDASTINLNVIYNLPPSGKKDNFVVCVKGLDFSYTDLSGRLIEWLELLFALGADIVDLYNLNIHPNISKVLNYYQQTGKVRVTPITLPGYQPNIPGLTHLYLKHKKNNKRQNELIPYNDCLYRNMYLYNFIILLDIDEVIVPKKVKTWNELMKLIVPKSLVAKKPRASYNARNVYFFDCMSRNNLFEDIPPYMHMLQHVYRSVNYSKPGHAIKCFHNPERVHVLHNHFPLACLGGRCSSYAIETDDAQLHHYRYGCSPNSKTCEKEFKKYTKLDLSVWKYKNQLINETFKVFNKLGFFQQLKRK